MPELEPPATDAPDPPEPEAARPGAHLRPRALWIAFAVFALGVPLLAWALRSL